MAAHGPSEIARFANQLRCAVQLASASPNQLADQARGFRRLLEEKPECAAWAEAAAEVFLATPTLKSSRLAGRAATRLTSGRPLPPEQELLLCVFAGEDATQAYLPTRRRPGRPRGDRRPRNAEADRTRRLAAQATLRYKAEREAARAPPPDATSVAEFPTLPAAPEQQAVPEPEKPRWADMASDED